MVWLKKSPIDAVKFSITIQLSPNFLSFFVTEGCSMRKPKMWNEKGFTNNPRPIMWDSKGFT